MMEIHSEIQKVPINTLTEHPLNKEYHSDLTSSEYALLLHDIKENGLQNPIFINKDGLILSGNWRWKICKQLGYEYIDAKVVDYSQAKELEHLIIDNKTHRSPEYDRIKLAKQIKLIYELWNISPGRKSVHDAQIKTRFHVEDVFGMDETKIRRHLQLLNLNQELQNLVSKDTIPFMGGVKLSTLSAETQSRFYNYFCEMEFPEITVQKIKEIIESFTNPEGNIEKHNDSAPNIENAIEIEEKEIAKLQKVISKVLHLNLSKGSKDKFKSTIISTLKKLEENA